jgi:hypothetical protein
VRLFNAIFGYSTGFFVAAFCSWAANHSIPWMLVNGLFSWLYVFYFFVMKYGTVHQAWMVVKALVG